MRRSIACAVAVFAACLLPTTLAHAQHACTFDPVRSPRDPWEVTFVANNAPCSPWLYTPETGSFWTGMGLNRGLWVGPFAPGPNASCPGASDTAYSRLMAALRLMQLVQYTWEPEMGQLGTGITPRYNAFADAAIAINDLRPSCSRDWNGHTTNWGGLIHQNVQLGLRFFESSVVQRAATLIHEARHIVDNKRHDANDSACENGHSCDSSWAYDGANRWGIEFLAAVVYNWHIDEDIRREAWRFADGQLRSRFVSSVRPNTVWVGTGLDGLGLPRPLPPPPQPPPVPLPEPEPGSPFEPPPEPQPEPGPVDPCSRWPYCSLEN